MAKPDLKAAFLTVQELAETLRVSEMTIRRLVGRGELPCHRVGRQMRFLLEDVQAYMDQAREGTRAKRPRERGLFNGIED